MSSKHIKELFESFGPTTQQRAAVYRRISAGQAEQGAPFKQHFPAKLALSLAVCCAAAVIAVLLLGRGLPDRGAPGPVQPPNILEGGPSESPVLPGETRALSLFHGFILTAYAAEDGTAVLGANFIEDAEKRVLVPDVQVLLAGYSPAMSIVPGLPFTVDLAGDGGLGADSLRVSVDKGGLLFWSHVTGVASSQGRSAVMAAGETIYWSALDGEESPVLSAVITVEAVTGGEVVARQQIHIAQAKEGLYYATVGDLELL